MSHSYTSEIFQTTNSLHVINISLSPKDPFIWSNSKLPPLTGDPEGTAPLTPNAARTSSCPLTCNHHSLFCDYPHRHPQTLSIFHADIFKYTSQQKSVRYSDFSVTCKLPTQTYKYKSDGMMSTLNICSACRQTDTAA